MEKNHSLFPFIFKAAFHPSQHASAPHDWQWSQSVIAWLTVRSLNLPLLWKSGRCRVGWECASWFCWVFVVSHVHLFVLMLLIFVSLVSAFDWNMEPPIVSFSFVQRIRKINPWEAGIMIWLGISWPFFLQQRLPQQIGGWEYPN